MATVDRRLESGVRVTYARKKSVISLPAGHAVLPSGKTTSEQRMGELFDTDPALRALQEAAWGKARS
jgi:hypothetical protein